MSEHFPFSGDVVPANSPGRKTVGQMMRPTTAIEPGAHLAAAAYLIKLAVLRSPQRSLGHYSITHTHCPTASCGFTSSSELGSICLTSTDGLSAAMGY